jgi:hypothetical protein
MNQEQNLLDKVIKQEAELHEHVNPSPEFFIKIVSPIYKINSILHPPGDKITPEIVKNKIILLIIYSTL